MDFFLLFKSVQPGYMSLDCLSFIYLFIIIISLICFQEDLWVKSFVLIIQRFQAQIFPVAIWLVLSKDFPPVFQLLPSPYVTLALF